MTIRTHIMPMMAKTTMQLFVNGAYWCTVHGDTPIIAQARADALATGIREAWRTMASAPLDGSPVDLWADGERYPDHYWSEPHSAWCVQRWMGKHEIVIVRTITPTHWRKPEGPTT